MKSDAIVRMANQIASFFAAYPREQAVTETAAHIRSFWDPRMRAQLQAHLEAGGDGLDPIVREAAEMLRPAPVSP
ncbi:formate dehydrogenase subunit delta [Azospirillum sp. RWY-5-1]|uniref:Formate dehydrogenase subunit delta n=1 Tax=Azospirillum oleiclasticum TaxID=2735135 RepID=A0ABX2TGW1_9PROT|nr:formate dehydrogenase subunit delta [Azospirillum oleiclasticum]NYZ14750.1 formate dehydrogenase subunit delta [Azospirillum oleiclasticum]NYZ22264.1 formate dehydrogenase subunit delta [Azospirillum oleiclasticum]